MITSPFGPSFVAGDGVAATRDATDFTRKDLSAEEGAEIMSDTFTYCADIAFGRGSLTSTRRCDWWNNYLVEQRKCFRKARKQLNRLKKRKVTGFAFDEALIAFRVARSRYRASVEKAKGNLLRRVVQRLESEGPWSPLYHEFKANRSVDLAFVQNIKVNNVHTTGIEETTEVLLDDSSLTMYPRQIAIIISRLGRGRLYHPIHRCLIYLPSMSS
ncbi:hypothetical protein SFRURICE_011701 [Spodoptera frugiperda]|nr:hypothetical protein SFRURICE_011701 [Spodoptera frugiperda]